MKQRPPDFTFVECAKCGQTIEFESLDDWKHTVKKAGLRYGNFFYFCSNDCKKAWENYKQENDGDLVDEIRRDHDHKRDFE